MGVPVLIEGESGSGKSFAIKGLPPDETGIKGNSLRTAGKDCAEGVFLFPAKCGRERALYGKRYSKNRAAASVRVLLAMTPR